MDTSYTLQLSPLELHWLAAAFNIMRLPLPDDPMRNVPPSQLEAAAPKAMQSLEARGLISRASARPQVDRLPIAIVRLLGLAAAALKIDIHRRGAATRHAQIFTQAGMIMYVELEGDQYTFVLFQDPDAVSDHLLAKAGGSFADAKPASKKKFTLSQPGTILPVAWTEPALATNMLKVVGYGSQEIPPLLEWAESLEWIIAVSSVTLNGAKNGNTKQAVLCGDAAACWSGSADGGADDQISLAPAGLKQVRELITRLSTPAWIRTWLSRSSVPRN